MSFYIRNIPKNYCIGVVVDLNNGIHLCIRIVTLAFDFRILEPSESMPYSGNLLFFIVKKKKDPWD